MIRAIGLANLNKGIHTQQQDHTLKPKYELRSEYVCRGGNHEPDHGQTKLHHAGEHHSALHAAFRHLIEEAVTRRGNKRLGTSHQ